MLSACEAIVDVICKDDFKSVTAHAIPQDCIVPGESAKPQCIAFDFGVCENESGELEPQLVEMQGFPSLYGFQVHLAKNYRHTFNINGNQTIYFNNLSSAGEIE